MYRDCIRFIAALTAALMVVCSTSGIVFAAEEQTEEQYFTEQAEEPETEADPEEETEPEEEEKTEEEEKPEEEAKPEEEKEFEEEAAFGEETVPEAAAEALPEEVLQVPMPPFDAEGQAGSITVLVHAGQEVFPEGTRAEIRELPSDEAASLLREAERLSGGAAGLSAVDITFLDREGKEIQPQGMVQVTFLDAAVYEEIAVYHVTDVSEGSMEEIRAEAVEGDVVFENDSFSPYILLGAAGSPDWTQGGAGTMKNVTGIVSLILRNAEWSNYYTWGRDYSSYNTTDALTVRYDVYYKGQRAGTASCINPQKDGDYAEGRQADAVYETTAPLLVKALYYGNNGPGKNVVQSVYNAGHDPGEDKNYGGPEIITHVAVSEIYSRLYPSLSKTGAGAGFAEPATALLKNDVNAFVSKLNSLPVPDNYCVYIVHYNANVQDFAVVSLPLARGKLYIRKTAAGTEITEGNPGYGLSGAVYRIYSSEAAAETGGDSGCVGELQTKADGTTDAWEGSIGTYYIKESSPPQGYLLDETIHRVTVTEGGTAALDVTEQPAVSVLPLRIQKKNRLDGAQQGRSLAGAKFEIKYYSGYYDEETLPEEASKTWTVTAAEKEDGTAEAVLKDGIPVGTVTVTETEAPSGYFMDGLFGNAALYIGQICRSEDGKGVCWKDIQGERAADDGQSILLSAEDTPFSPEIRTQARDAENGTDHSLADEAVRIIDSVTCKNLIPGKEYTLRGRLVDRSSGNVITDAEGREVTAEKTFIAADLEEEIQELVFEFAADPSLAGKAAVVFERLIGSEADLAGAVHEDLDDEDQTIFFPFLETSAEDQSDHDKTISPEGQAVVIDRIEYSNLIPGAEYKMMGVLMDKRTGKTALSDGKEIRGETGFIPETEEGVTQVALRFNAEGLREGEYVVFEELYMEREGEDSPVIIAQHKDINSASQTVVRAKKAKTETPAGTSAGTPRTGDDFGLAKWAVLCAAALGSIIFALSQRRQSFS